MAQLPHSQRNTHPSSIVTPTAPNLEEELAACDWFIAKVRASDIYAQNVYAACCNMQWQKLDVMPILKDELWGCSWRYSGGMVAEFQDKGGDYMDFYCSGIRGAKELDNDGLERGHVSESEVTEEIREDFLKLGWQPVPYDDKDMV